MSEEEMRQEPQNNNEPDQGGTEVPPQPTQVAEATAGSPEPVASEQKSEEGELFQHPRNIKELKPGMVLEGRVTSVAIYGVFVDIGVGREGLVHVSQLGERNVTNPAEVVQIGEMVTVRVLEVDPRSKRISLTMREREEPPKVDTEKLSTLEPGSTVEGKVTSLTKFGAFVDVGVGRDGLVPLSQIGPGGAKQAGDVLQVGEQVRVRVMDVDKKTGRIRLSMRNVYDREQMSTLQAGSVVHGRVTSLAPFGAFVDLGVGKDGLIHVSQMGGNVRHPGDVLQVGQEVDVRVVEVDPETQRISLSMQLEEEEPWQPEPEASIEEEQAEEAFPENPTLEDLAARFNAMRAGGREEAERRTTQAEKEKRALREAQRRTLQRTPQG